MEIRHPIDDGTGGVLNDTGRRDKLFGSSGTDRFTLGRDGKTDSVIDFRNGYDKIDLSAFDVTFGSMAIKYKGPGEYVVTIRAERTIIKFAVPELGDPALTRGSLDASDFIFAPGAPVPGPQTQIDRAGVDRLHGTNLPDVFVFTPDGVRDAVRHFEDGKDRIDLAAFNTTFAELIFIDRKPGRVVVRVDTGGGTEDIVVHDSSRLLTSADLGADDFLF